MTSRTIHISEPERQTLLQAMADLSHGRQASCSTGILAATLPFFLTVYAKGEPLLHISRLEGDLPLGQALAEAIPSLLHDPRLQGLDEADRELALDLLGDFQTCADPDGVDLSRQALRLEVRGRTGMFPPWYGISRGWSARGVLEKLCGEVALPPGVWRDKGAALSCCEFTRVGAPLSTPPQQESATTLRQAPAGILNYIGQTPFVRLQNLSKKLGCSLHVKMENRNPGGSSLDRVALAYLEQAFALGELSPGGSIVEAADDALGFSLALCCANFGLHLTLCVPATLGKNQVEKLRGTGANVLVTPPEQGLAGARALAEDMHKDIWGSWRPRHGKNPLAVTTHYRTTGTEIATACLAQGLRPDIFLLAAKSGATFSGVAARLREDFPNVRTVLVEASLPERENGSTPPLLDEKLVDERIMVDLRDVEQTRTRIWKLEALPFGPASNVHLHAALLLSRRPECAGAGIVTVLCD